VVFFDRINRIGFTERETGMRKLLALAMMVVLCGCGSEPRVFLTPAEKAELDKRITQHGRAAIISYLKEGVREGDHATHIIMHLDYLISQGADINAKDEHNNTSLYLAVKADKVEIAKFLISKGVDVGARRVHFTIAIDDKKLVRNLMLAQPDLKEDAALAESIKMMNAVDDLQIVKTIQDRLDKLDKLGISETVIQAESEHRFSIQLSVITDEQRKRVEHFIQSTGLLEFKPVHPKNDTLVRELLASGKIPEGYVSDGDLFKRGPDYDDLVGNDPEYLTRLSRFEVTDPRYALMFEQADAVSATSKEASYRPIFVLRKAEMDGSALSSASVNTSVILVNEIVEKKVPNVSIKFNTKGAKAFAEITKNNIGRRLAIVLDGTILLAPSIYAEIQGGEAEISSSRFSIAEATLLCDILNAGTLPVPMKIVENRFVDLPEPIL
jgi:protein-export membrane protein SecD